MLATAVFVLAATRPAPAFDHGVWDTLLHRYVDDAGRVAYRDLAARDGTTLDGYLGALAEAHPEGWTRDEQVAFWVNAYNAVIVRAVLDGHTAEGFFARRRLFTGYSRPVAGKPRTPDDIEKNVLHGFGEARLHFALVCASTSCPRLRRRAWVAERLDADLEEAARQFLADRAKNQIDVGAPAVHLSMIFDWYEDDFDGSAEAVRAFVARYVDPARRRYLEDAHPDVEYLSYDWTLNAQPGQRPES